MTDPRFRITNVAFDEKENVETLTMIARDDTYQVIKDLLGGIEPTNVTRLGTEMIFVLSLAKAMELGRECGQIRGSDPRREYTRAVFDSLSRIYYGLIEDN